MTHHFAEIVEKSMNKSFKLIKKIKGRKCQTHSKSIFLRKISLENWRYYKNEIITNATVSNNLGFHDESLHKEELDN